MLGIGNAEYFSSAVSSEARNQKQSPVLHNRRFHATEKVDIVTKGGKITLVRLHVRHARRVRVHDVVREVDEKLCKASLGGRIIPEDGGEGGVPQRLRKALP